MITSTKNDLVVKLYYVGTTSVLEWNELKWCDDFNFE